MSETSDRRSGPAIASLGGLRGVAALWVMGFHYSWAAASAGRLPLTGVPVLRDGWAAVDLFFILSGFVLMRGYGAAFARPTLGGVLAYARARAIRIYPVSTVALAGVALLVAADAGFARWFAALGPGNLSPASFLTTLLLANQWLPVAGAWNSPVWSLSVELVGYAALPALAAWLAPALSARRLVTLAALLVVTMLAIELRLGVLGMNDQSAPGSFVRMGFGFAAGACLLRGAALAPDGWQRAMPAVAMFSAGAIALLTLLPLGVALMPLPFAGLIFALSFQRGLVDRALRLPLAQFLGRISFPLYLLHFMPGLAYCKTIGTRSTVTDPVFFAGSALLIAAVILLAAACHRWVEAPAHRLARRWSRQVHDGDRQLRWSGQIA